MIILKSNNEILKIKRAGKIVAETLVMLEEIIRPGMTTADLDAIAEEFISKQGGKPSFKGYCGFPASLCISVNEEVIHGIPSRKKILCNGDIVSIDCGVLLDGFHGDAARTFVLEGASKEAVNLVEVTKQCFYKGIEKAVVGNRVSDISNAIEKHANSFGFSAVQDYVGHGIGRNLHEDPNVPNFGVAGKGPLLKHGMVLAIEPMINYGEYKVKTLKDKWTVVTKDGSLSAHYENTIVVTNNGIEILTTT